MEYAARIAMMRQLEKDRKRYQELTADLREVTANLREAINRRDFRTQVFWLMERAYVEWKLKRLGLFEDGVCWDAHMWADIKRADRLICYL